MPAIMEVDNLTKKYGDFQAVKGISFSVEEGEVFGAGGDRGGDGWSATATNRISSISSPVTKPASRA